MAVLHFSGLFSEKSWENFPKWWYQIRDDLITERIGKKTRVICLITSLMCSWNLNRLACKKCNSAKEEINKFMKETENINVWGKGKCPSDMILKKKKKKEKWTDWWNYMYLSLAFVNGGTTEHQSCLRSHLKHFQKPIESHWS